MQNFKHVLNVTWSKEKDFFNWLLNLKNLVLSNGSRNVQSVIQIALNSNSYFLRKNCPAAEGFAPRFP